MKNPISLLHCNIRSLQANQDNLVDLINNLNFDYSIIGLSEIKFQVGKDTYSNTSINNYSCLSQPSQSAAAGVGFYINNKLKFSERDDLNTTSNSYESIWIEVKDSSGEIFLCSVFYRHPKTDLTLFLNELYATIDKISKENKRCVIMGDFNIDLLNYESHHLTEEYINKMNSLSFQPMITKPTRINDHSATLIDHIFFNSLEYYTVSGNIIYISDHLPNFVLIDNANIQNKSKKVFKRDNSNCDRNALIEDFKMVDWTYHFHSRNTVDEMYDTFYAITDEIINKHIPLKKTRNLAEL